MPSIFWIAIHCSLTVTATMYFPVMGLGIVALFLRLGSATFWSCEELSGHSCAVDVVAGQKDIRGIAVKYWRYRSRLGFGWEAVWDTVSGSSFFSVYRISGKKERIYLEVSKDALSVECRSRDVERGFPEQVSIARKLLQVAAFGDTSWWASMASQLSPAFEALGLPWHFWSDFLRPSRMWRFPVAARWRSFGFSSFVAGSEEFEIGTWTLEMFRNGYPFKDLFCEVLSFALGKRKKTSTACCCLARNHNLLISNWIKQNKSPRKVRKFIGFYAHRHLRLDPTYYSQEELPTLLDHWKLDTSLFGK